MVVFWAQTGLRGLSFVALWVAILTACFLIARHALPLFVGSQPPISLKSAVPLIAIGISYSVRKSRIHPTVKKLTAWRKANRLSQPKAVAVLGQYYFHITFASL